MTLLNAIIHFNLRPYLWSAAVTLKFFLRQYTTQLRRDTSPVDSEGKDSFNSANLFLTELRFSERRFENCFPCLDFPFKQITKAASKGVIA